jgi:hypothetical protein
MLLAGKPALKPSHATPLAVSTYCTKTTYPVIDARISRIDLTETPYLLPIMVEKS